MDYPDISSRCASCVVNTTAGATSFTPSTALASNTTYTWQVHALGNPLGGTWSRSEKRRVGAGRPSPPMLNAPVNAENAISSRPSFSWSAMSEGGATGYYRQQTASDAAD